MIEALTAVVFDCDGVLVDSEPHSLVAWLDVLADLGHAATEADVKACIGLGFDPTHAALCRIGPLPGRDEVWPALLAALRRSFDRGLEVFDDAIGLLDAASAAGLRTAVASTSPRSRLDLTLRVAGLAGRFEASVSGDEVAAGKPDPAVYLAALDRLGVAAANAAAIEDSVAGVQSARAAGLWVLAVVRNGADRAALAEVGATVVDGLAPFQLGIGADS